MLRQAEDQKPNGASKKKARAPSRVKDNISAFELSQAVTWLTFLNKYPDAKWVLRILCDYWPDPRLSRRMIAQLAAVRENSIPDCTTFLENTGLIRAKAHRRGGGHHGTSWEIDAEKILRLARGRRKVLEAQREQEPPAAPAGGAATQTQPHQSEPLAAPVSSLAAPLVPPFEPPAAPAGGALIEVVLEKNLEKKTTTTTEAGNPAVAAAGRSQIGTPGQEEKPAPDRQEFANAVRLIWGAHVPAEYPLQFTDAHLDMALAVAAREGPDVFLRAWERWLLTAAQRDLAIKVGRRLDPTTGQEVDMPGYRAWPLRYFVTSGAAAEYIEKARYGAVIEKAEGSAK